MIDELALAVMQMHQLSAHQHQIIGVIYAPHNCRYRYTYFVLIGVEVLAR